MLLNLNWWKHLRWLVQILFTGLNSLASINYYPVPVVILSVHWFEFIYLFKDSLMIYTFWKKNFNWRCLIVFRNMRVRLWLNWMNICIVGRLAMISWHGNWDKKNKFPHLLVLAKMGMNNKKYRFRKRNWFVLIYINAVFPVAH